MNNVIHATPPGKGQVVVDFEVDFPTFLSTNFHATALNNGRVVIDLCGEFGMF